ncbi:MAG: stalk domain-containing protein [Eubacteriales bacterium]
MKGKLITCFILSLIILAFAAPASAEPVYRATFYTGQSYYIVNDRLVKMDAAPFIENSRAYVPVRHLGTALGVTGEKINWSQSAKTVTLSREGVTVVLAIGGDTIYVNDQPRKIDVVPVLKNGRTYLPARYVAEAFGYDVGWDQNRQAVLIGPPGGLPESPQFGAINVPVANLWTEPGSKREYDATILGGSTDPAAWAAGMDTNMKMWLVGKVDTQALFGERVAVLERRGDWLKVAAMSQRTQLNSLGYPGWAPAAQVSFNPLYLSDKSRLEEVVAAEPLAGLYHDAALTDRAGGLCYQTRLPVLAEEGGAFLVRLPDGGTGYLSREEAKKAGGLSFSGAGVIREARRFLGLGYIWAGTSSYGFDCSGFTFRVFQSQGISIPRDADEQAKEGLPVAREDLKPGDLIFFASNGGTGEIHHVGLYVGGGRMIHAPDSRSSVREDPIGAGTYGAEYWGARRYGESNEN